MNATWYPCYFRCFVENSKRVCSYRIRWLGSFRPVSAKSDSCGPACYRDVPDRDGDGLGIFARMFDDDGEPTSPEFQVNTYTTGNQWFDVPPTRGLAADALQYRSLPVSMRRARRCSRGNPYLNDIGANGRSTGLEHTRNRCRRSQKGNARPAHIRCRCSHNNRGLELRNPYPRSSHLRSWTWSLRSSWSSMCIAPDIAVVAPVLRRLFAGQAVRHLRR